MAGVNFILGQFQLICTIGSDLFICQITVCTVREKVFSGLCTGLFHILRHRRCRRIRLKIYLFPAHDAVHIRIYRADRLARQLAEKKAEVEQLRESLVRMGDEVKSLTEEVAVRSAEVENLSGEKVELQNQLNTVYYIVGAEKELRDAQIINKQGFIGRTLTVGRNSNFDSFTMTDSRLLSEVPVGQKKATLVTSHPEGSYELVTDANKVVEKLIITDPVRFWESSKILIISCK